MYKFLYYSDTAAAIPCCSNDYLRWPHPECFAPKPSHAISQRSVHHLISSIVSSILACDYIDSLIQRFYYFMDNSAILVPLQLFSFSLNFSTSSIGSISLPRLFLLEISYNSIEEVFHLTRKPYLIFLFYMRHMFPFLLVRSRFVRSSSCGSFVSLFVNMMIWARSINRTACNPSQFVERLSLLSVHFPLDVEKDLLIFVSSKK